MYTNSKKTPKTNQKSTSFSISSILSSEKAGKDVTSLKRKHEEQSRVAIGRQGVAKLMQPDALSDQVTVTLENRELWGIFHEVGTEMVITKSGRRMFPALKFSVTGLDPSLRYIVMIDVIPADNYRYKYHESEWLVTGKAYPDVAISKRVHTHAESPCNGAKWMSSVVSFHKVKITNNASDSKIGHIVLNSLHKYQPRIHIIQAASFDRVTDKNSMTFVFPETSFMAVTAYQSEQITQLKIDNNPFAKGFRDPSPSDIERARLMNSMHYGISSIDYPYNNNVTATPMVPQGICHRSQCLVPYSAPSDAWMVQQQLMPVMPQQKIPQPGPYGMPMMPKSSLPPKRLKHSCSPICQCVARGMPPPHPYSAEHESNMKSNDDLFQSHSIRCTSVGCTCSNNCAAVVYSSHHEHLSSTSSSTYPPSPLRSVTNYGRGKYACSCCLGHSQTRWTNHAGQNHCKPPIF